jgi:hypothetical protein
MQLVWIGKEMRKKRGIVDRDAVGKKEILFLGF